MLAIFGLIERGSQPKLMRIRCRTRAVVLVCTLAVASRASGQDHVHLTPPQQLVDVSARIVNGVLTAQYPSVGILMDSSNPNLATLLCSGTLIGCQTFLTAGHCVAPDHNPQHYSVFLGKLVSKCGTLSERPGGLFGHQGILRFAKSVGWERNGDTGILSYLS